MTVHAVSDPGAPPTKNGTACRNSCNLKHSQLIQQILKAFKMLFAEEDTPFLKIWIVKRLENISDADADVLADYVLALLRHDGDEDAVRQLCEAEMPDFLKEDSSIFVRDVFNAIHYKSYLPGAPQPQAPLSTLNPPTGPSVQQIQPQFHGNLGAPPAPMGSHSNSRKRTYNDHADIGGFGQPDGGGGRQYKQARRGAFPGGRGNRYDDYNGARSRPQLQQGFQPGGLSGSASGIPTFDPSNPLAAVLAMQQAMGLPVPGMPSFPSGAGGAPAVKKQRCRDYDTKGFCARGNNCMYEHGVDSIYVPPGTDTDEYDPSNSALMSGFEVAPGIASENFRGDRGRGRGKGQRGDRGGPSGRGRGGRAEFSSDRPNFDKSKTIIVVENIPEEKFSEEAVREFFSQFGNIAEVTMKQYKRLALIKYDDWEAANSAYSSPKVIFDNRFVKVYWYKNPESLPQPPSSKTPANGIANGGHDGAGNISGRATSEPQIDIEEFSRKQQEVQKAHEEKMRKKQEMETARKELEKRQEELLRNQAEEKRRLLERLAAKTGTSTSSNTTQDGEATVATGEKTSAQTEALKAQLAALEAEAKSLGIDPSASEDASWSSRGRGRGRGAIRGRGTYFPSRSRGGYRGRGGFAYGGAGAYKLDNRTKKVSVTGIDFTNPEKDESLRQYLLGVGEFTDLETTSDSATITFKDRFTAEKFMYGTAGGEIPSVGKVEMAWVQGSLPVTGTANTSSPAKFDGNEDTAMDEGDAMAQDSGTGHGDGYGREQPENLDYDVADDNDWAIQ
ncbi:hypothetical protein F5884DRAFT_797965 [Xylogone sp. PMI_703]|nr:hypothetical protein F5884DRAFT_797965 [Xylogone sp. PMI_703]